MADKKKITFYIEVTTLESLKKISGKTLISQNKIVQNVLDEFVKYFESTGKVFREA